MIALSEDVFRLLVLTSSDMVYRMSADWRHMHLLIGKEFLADTLVPADSWLQTYIPVAAQAPVQAAIGQAIRQQHLFEYEHPVIRADGTTGWVYSRAIPIHNDQGALVEWIGTARDITARKQKEQELEQHLNLLEQAEQVAQLGCWVADLATGTLRWSAGLYQLFGLTPGTPVAPTIFRTHVTAASQPAAARIVAALTSTPSAFEETLQLDLHGELRTLRLRAVVLPDEAGQPSRLVGVAVDVSEVEQLQAANLQLRLRQQQQQFEAVLVAQETERQRIAEALHNGVGQVLYAAKLQLDQLRPAAPDAAWDYTQHLLSEAIRQVRAVSHELVPPTLKDFGLMVALRDIGHALQTPQLRFVCQVHLPQPEQPLPQSLQVVVYRMAQELAQNIVKHAAATQATLTVQVEPGHVELRAEDNGRGFGPHRPGTGLGLRSIQDRVALLGGTCSIGPATAGGSCVQIRLPLPATA